MPRFPMDPMGSLDLGPLPRHWDGVFALGQQVETYREPRTDLGFTARGFDESQPAGHRGYMLAYGYIQSGLEHLDALIELVTTRGATPRVPWTILRAVFEAGFWSTWLMEPSDGLERRRRGLRLELRGHIERSNFYDDFLRSTPEERAKLALKDQEHEKTYRAEAEQLRLPWAAARNRINLHRELGDLWLLKNSDPKVQGPTLGVWRSLSGMQHGYAYALLAHSDTDSEQEILGGQRVRLTIKDSSFQALATTANLMLIEGMSLYIRRNIRT